jgi:hypothetical protein
MEIVPTNTSGSVYFYYKLTQNSTGNTNSSSNNSSVSNLFTGSKKTIAIVVASVCGALVLALIGVGIFCIVKCIKKRRAAQQVGYDANENGTLDDGKESGRWMGGDTYDTAKTSKGQLDPYSKGSSTKRGGG